MSLPPSTYLMLAVAAFLAGAVNAVAGGGTLLTFPTLTALISPAAANVTSTVALLPGSLAGAWGYRRQLRQTRGWLVWLLPPSFAGGGLGALLLLIAPDRFAALVPWLILLTAILFLVQRPLTRLLRSRVAETPEPVRLPQYSLGLVGLVGVQLAIATYGGYFGAGIGILMLTALGFMGVGSIHQANGLKTVLASCINVTSALIFGVAGEVHWDFAAVMAAASVLGGYAGARTALKLPATVVRTFVIMIAFGLAGYYFLVG